MASYCLTEAGAGSDAGSRKTKAGRDGDDYIVTGSKQFISGGGENEIYVVMVRKGDDGPKGISCLVIEKDMAGVSFGAQDNIIGRHSPPTATVNFDGVGVAAENQGGSEGEGIRIGMIGIEGGRLNSGAGYLGGGERWLGEGANLKK